MKFLPCLMLALIPAVFTTAEEPLTDPVLLVEEALANYGGPGWLDEAGALVIEHRGYTDLATRLQGRQWEMAERYPATEELAVAAGGVGTEAAADRPRHITLAPGVHLAPGVRAGFHHLFVELDEYVAVVDAPTGWQEFDRLPAGEWVAGADDDAVARRLIEIVGEAVPDKPIRYLILTHHHSGHSGGFRPFLEIGARIVATSETVELLERELNDPDASVEERFQIVESRERLGDGERTLEIIHVGPNPHSEGMLVAWLPEERILYQSDLFFPASEEHFPDRARLSVMRWFTDWLARSGLEPKEIRSIHGTSKVTAAQLERIRAVAERRAVLISVDGLRTDYLTKAEAHGLRIPTLRALMTAGITAEGVVPPTPSNTMPGHTTLITGVWPDRHGIHGYVPDSADMHAALVAVGPRLQRTARTGVLPMTAVAPAIADWLRLGLGTAVQREPDFAYRRGEGWSCRTDLPAEG